MIGLGRGAWVASSYVIWVPDNLLFSAPALRPVDYWVSSVWLLRVLVPPYILEKSAAARFTLGALGSIFEENGRRETSNAGVQAAGFINERVREAVVDAEFAADDVCENVVYVDLVGHSRGGAVITHALRNGFGTRSNYNFDVSTTLLDVIDPTPGDEMRPWITPGYIVGDPLITRVGNEWNSSFFGNDSSGEGGIWGIEDFVALVPGGFESAEVIRSRVVGLPKGRNRQAELESAAVSFGAYQGPIGGIRHKEFAGDPTQADPNLGIGFMWVRPEDQAAPEGVTSGGIPGNQVRAPSTALTGASQFAMLTSSHLGRFLDNPRGFDTTTAFGFHTSSTFDGDDELGCLPEGCQPVVGTCNNTIDEEDGRAQNARDSSGLVVRELVPDFDFRLISGAVLRSTRLVDDYPNLKDIIPNDELADLRSAITTTDADQWLADGTWQRIGNVTAGATIDGVEVAIRPYVAHPDVDYSTLDTDAEMDGERARFQAELDALSSDEERDRASTLSLAAAGMTSGNDAWLQFPSSTSYAFTDLRTASLSATDFLVRVEYEVTSASGMLTVSLKGPGGLSGSGTWSHSSGSGRRVAELVVSRAAAQRLGLDELTLKGGNVRVYAASVRPSMPFSSSVTSSAYEFVMLETGVTMERAAALASRSVWQGQSGRLARIPNTALLDEFRDVVAADGRGFVDVRSKTGDAGSFYDGGDQSVSDSLFRTGTSFVLDRPRGAHGYTWPAAKDGRLGHAHPGASVDGQRTGFWIEYPGLGNKNAAMAATGDSSMTALFSALVEFFSDATDTTVATDLELPPPLPVTAQPLGAIPVCLAADQSCFDE